MERDFRESGSANQWSGFLRSLVVANMNKPRQLINNTPWTAIETMANDSIKEASVSTALPTSATKPHVSQINGNLHASILGL